MPFEFDAFSPMTWFREQPVLHRPVYEEPLPIFNYSRPRCEFGPARPREWTHEDDKNRPDLRWAVHKPAEKRRNQQGGGKRKKKSRARK